MKKIKCISITDKQKDAIAKVLKEKLRYKESKMQKCFILKVIK